MRAFVRWRAATFLIALLGSACVDPATTISPTTPARRASDVAPSALPQQSPIDIRGEELEVVQKKGVDPLTIDYATKATVDLDRLAGRGFHHSGERLAG